MRRPQAPPGADREWDRDQRSVGCACARRPRRGDLRRLPCRPAVEPRGPVPSLSGYLDRKTQRGRLAPPSFESSDLPVGHIGWPAPLFTACLSWLPAENFGTVVAGICTRCEGFLGLTPCRAARAWVVNFPKPVKATSPPPR